MMNKFLTHSFDKNDCGKKQVIVLEKNVTCYSFFTERSGFAKLLHARLRFQLTY